jgi:hypothetical protein
VVARSGLSTMTLRWRQRTTQGEGSLANDSEGEGVRELRHILEHLGEEGGRKGLTVGSGF